MRGFIIFIFIFLCLTGCETSFAWYATHPEKQTVEINGLKFGVVPRDGENRYDVFPDSTFVAWDDVVQKKKDQIRAVETVTGCNVIEGEYLSNTFVLQTIVNCG